ncbi:MAG: flavodoxin-dependent (E)-4-hydroxy-3-methylbut-2-enyl-diphosphate synthase, partial [Clostridia bacterium]|nr:flavodoxin-dependent (E)-4-hydroxy-3-methylbut-2-enyl-diphosphate synthase [Clostridia bacterium]
MKRLSRTVRVGNLEIGGSNPIAVQSMTNIDTADIPAVTEQLKALKSAGCHIVRFAVNSMEAVKAIPVYKTVTDMPLVADIHFDYRLALAAADAGIDKIRINPGNIGAEENIKAVVNKCREKNIPIRIGINGGSLEKELLAKYGSPTAEAIAESALNNARILEKYDF